MEVVGSILFLLLSLASVLSHNAPGLPGIPPNIHNQAGSSQGGHPHEEQPIQRRQGAPPHAHHSFKDGVKDREHMMEHLDGVVNRGSDTERMSEDEVQFHYFKLHDYDNNNMLDGIELVSALTHYHKDEDPNNIKPLSDSDLQNLVDTILKEDDRSNDGYVDYAEFILSQRT